MNKKLIAVAALLAMEWGAAGAAVAAPRCVTVSGLARLDPAPDCSAMVVAYPEQPYLGQPGTCFVSTVVGSLTGQGLSGLTAELATSPLSGGVTPTPLVLKEGGLSAVQNEFGLQETRRVFTARSVLRLAKGMLYTADAGVLNRSGSTEQLEVTRGTGAFAGATGTLYLTGNVIQNWANYTGRLCTP